MLKLPRHILLAAITLLTLTTLTRAQTTAPDTQPIPALDLGPNGETLITLHLEDALAEDIFSDLTKQSGIHFHFYPETLLDDLQDPITLNLDKKPFWPALEEICDKANLNIPQNATGRQINLQKKMVSQHARPTFSSPPFLFRADYITISQTLDFSNPQQTNRQCNIQGFACIDPNIRLAGPAQAKITEALDDKGNSLLYENNQSFNPGMMMGNPLVTYMYLRIQLPKSNAGTKITSLKGIYTAQIQTKSETAEFTDLLTAKDVVKTVGDCTITLKQVKKTNQTIEVFISAAAPPAHLAPNIIAPNIINSLYYALRGAQLYDDKDNAFFGQNGGGFNSMSPDHVEFALRFYRDPYNNRGPNVTLPDPARLVFEIPTETKEIKVPFEFHDLPLPTSAADPE